MDSRFWATQEALIHPNANISGWWPLRVTGDFDICPGDMDINSTDTST